MNAKFYDDLQVSMPKGCSFNYGYYSTPIGNQITIFREKYLDFDYEVYALNLYDRVTVDLALKGKMGIDFSCGRAGGSAYLAYAKNLKLMYATDRSKGNIAFAQSKFGNIQALKLEVLTAENISYPSSYFDFVLNIASFRLYQEPKKVFTEFLRILKAGGDLIIADQFDPNQIDSLLELIDDTAGISLVNQSDLTQATLAAMEFTQSEKRGLIDQFAFDDEARNVALEWGGLPGSNVFDQFTSKRSFFKMYHIKKHP